MKKTEYDVIVEDHREDTNSCIDFIEIWCLKGGAALHRENGPAYISYYKDGKKCQKWFKNGKAHREDGPAKEFQDGVRYWYIEGKQLTEKEFNNRNKKKDSCDGKVVLIDGKEYVLSLKEK